MSLSLFFTMDITSRMVGISTVLDTDDPLTNFGVFRAMVMSSGQNFLNAPLRSVTANCAKMSYFNASKDQ